MLQPVINAAVPVLVDSHIDVAVFPYLNGSSPISGIVVLSSASNNLGLSPITTAKHCHFDSVVQQIDEIFHYMGLPQSLQR